MIRSGASPTNPHRLFKAMVDGTPFEAPVHALSRGVARVVVRESIEIVFGIV